MERWSLTPALSRVGATPWANAVRRRREYPADPERLISGNPVLLLAGPRTPASIEALVRTWNPTPTRDDLGVLHVADGVRWHGPFHLDPTLSAQADLPAGWSTAYVAQAPRRRSRIPDGRNAQALRKRFPRDIPTGPEALAWSLVTGLARLLGGAARLPGCPSHVAEPQETVFCVYGHEALPWQVLRSILGLAIPDLGRNGVLAANNYCLDRPGALEIRVQPFGAEEFLPYALRSRADEGWPLTVYRFSCVKQATLSETVATLGRVREAAALLSEVIGGVLLDADGFPVSA
ncbi:hypothetical protein KGA66_18795 [Actinocrinis puniceicyclus]|uniref:Uncharacterized protein n=1 Tax=Actinocrinis puniceicyclus TaxID=977794 RepID=A0A8J7WMH8_9ACTN|nr:hypothetical protein [Actinocrinis puniceicyclus]MBS2965113.1 hypothetical protein [Actinocrinis puniceicyclus]